MVEHHCSAAISLEKIDMRNSHSAISSSDKPVQYYPPAILQNSISPLYPLLQNLKMKKLFRAHDLKDVVSCSGKFLNPYLSVERRPLHSSPQLHALSNDWFEARFGLRFRSKTLFCTGNLYSIFEYCNDGRVPISISPIGDFKLCFSDKCKDMYRHFKSIGGFPLEKNQIWSELDSLNYQVIENISWQKAAEAGCEIMIFAHEFEYKRESF